MAKITKEEIIESLKEMTMLEIHELIQAIEKVFEVSAAAPVAVAAKEAEAEEKTSFDVHITDIGPKRVGVIKALKTILLIGLLDAKKMVEGNLPIIVKEGTTKEDAEELKGKLEAAGATVELK